MNDETIDAIRALLLDLPALRDWPLAAALLGRQGRRPLSSWELCLDACEAVGAPRRRALPAAAASFAMLLGIHLVDDLLDDEPDGLFRRAGAGPTANLALALQAAALCVIDAAGFDPPRHAAVQRSLARMALATAWGQELDTRPTDGGEAAYWRVVEAKTPPLFASALCTGALAGGASVELAEAVGALGTSLGRLIQVSDDLKDAMERPARPDWRGAHSLPILYASTAAHDERERFLALRERSDDPAALIEAQTILFRSGAVGYCAWHLIDSYRTLDSRIGALALASPEPLLRMARAHIEPVEGLLAEAGVEAPERLVRGDGATTASHGALA